MATSHPSSPSAAPPSVRKALSRQYKDNPPAMGVYLIRNPQTQRLVLRASLNLDGAINRDRFELRLGRHRDAVLQADWQRLGEAGLSFEVVEVIKPRPEPDFDPKEALALSLALWREELLPPQAAR